MATATSKPDPILPTRTAAAAVPEAIDAAEQHAAALERLVMAQSGPQATLADRVETILDIVLDHVGLEAAELGRVKPAGFSAWYAARRVHTDAPRPDTLADCAAAALTAGAATALTGSSPACLAAAPLLALDEIVIVVWGSARTAPLSARELRFLDLAGKSLSAAVSRHRMRQALIEERDELAMILRNVRAYVASVEDDGRLMAVNDAARHAHRPAESLAQDLVCIGSGEPRFGILENWDEEDGAARWMRTDRIPYAAPGDGGTRLLVVATDVTELVEKEQLLAKANAGLNQFAYIASHDLQEPLRKIGTFTDLMLRGLDRGDREDVDYGVRVIKDSARRASMLISDLLAWSRLTNRPLERTTVSVAAVVRETLADLMSARPDQDVSVTDMMVDAAIQADASKLHQLVENLVTNALKYRHADRPLTLALEFRRSASGGFIFSIADNGIGFDQSYASVIFEPFRRLHGDRQYAGTGVGLAICAMVCERHGWTISAEGRPGEGATFRVIMPARSIR